MTRMLNRAGALGLAALMSAGLIVSGTAAPEAQAVKTIHRNTGSHRHYESCVKEFWYLREHYKNQGWKVKNIRHCAYQNVWFASADFYK
ncbi:hypothetical protein [Acidipropionibacterium thoenii]|uniref:hypothetical protein n=1 Tax=Acidipropionibacterium thoenii TaxID=1751 RepID=UPI00047F6738|nr:hypothetical protein [Acidipropionibacterium thoenii]